MSEHEKTPKSIPALLEVAWTERGFQLSASLG